MHKAAQRTGTAGWAWSQGAAAGKRKQDAADSPADWLGEEKTPVADETILKAARILVASADGSGAGSAASGSQGPMKHPPEQDPQPWRQQGNLRFYNYDTPSDKREPNWFEPKERLDSGAFHFPDTDARCPVCGFEPIERQEGGRAIYEVKNLSRSSSFRRNEGYGTCGHPNCAKFAQEQLDLYQMLGNISEAHTSLRTYGQMVVSQAARSPLGDQLMVEIASMRDVITEMIDSANRDYANLPVTHAETRRRFEEDVRPAGALLAAMIPPKVDKPGQYRSWTLSE